MSEREADEVARHGEVLRWSSDSDEDKAKDNASDSEEPTEFGVVWERVHHHAASCCGFHFMFSRKKSCEFGRG